MFHWNPIGPFPCGTPPEVLAAEGLLSRRPARPASTLSHQSRGTTLGTPYFLVVFDADRMVLHRTKWELCLLCMYTYITKYAKQIASKTMTIYYIYLGVSENHGFNQLHCHLK